MDPRKLIYSIAVLALLYGTAFADTGDRIEERLDDRGDRIDRRLDRKGRPDRPQAGSQGRTHRPSP